MLRLEDGSRVHGFLCESAATAGAEEITHQGSWTRYLLCTQGSVCS